MSDTPETDGHCGLAVTGHYGPSESECLVIDGKGPFVSADFARKLERERDEARALLAEMQQALKWATSYANEALQ